MNWQTSADNTRLIGHMILRKYYDGEDILGLKVNGGQPTGNGGSCGAIVEKVKRGSVADLEGCIRSGKETFTEPFESTDHPSECRVGLISEVIEVSNQKLQPESPPA